VQDDCVTVLGRKSIHAHPKPLDFFRLGGGGPGTWRRRDSPQASGQFRMVLLVRLVAVGNANDGPDEPGQDRGIERPATLVKQGEVGGVDGVLGILWRTDATSRGQELGAGALDDLLGNGLVAFGEVAGDQVIQRVLTHSNPIVHARGNR
jgi:hypothetical protein